MLHTNCVGMFMIICMSNCTQLASVTEHRFYVATMLYILHHETSSLKSTCIAFRINVFLSCLVSSASTVKPCCLLFHYLIIMDCIVQLNRLVSGATTFITFTVLRSLSLVMLDLLHYTFQWMQFNCVLALSTFIPGDAAWYWIWLPYAFSGITVWHTDIRMRNSLMYGAVGCPDWRFCGTIKYSNMLRLAVYCNVQDLHLPAETVHYRIFYPPPTQLWAQTSKHLQFNIPYLKMAFIPQRKHNVLHYKNES